LPRNKVQAKPLKVNSTGFFSRGKYTDIGIHLLEFFLSFFFVHPATLQGQLVTKLMA